MKTAVSIPDELFEMAEKAARREGLSRSRLYSTALAKYLAAEGESADDPVTVRLDAIADIINGLESPPSDVVARYLIDTGTWEW